MISLYSGTPGSGKSLHIAEKIYNRIKHGHATICNFPVKVNYKKFKAKRFYNAFTYVDNSELTVAFLVNYSKQYFKGRTPKEGQILLVIDEAGILFNSRDYSHKDRSDWCKFFSQHRKLGYDVVLIAQFDRMLDRQVRAQIEYEIIHRKVSNFGIPGIIMSVLFVGKLFVAVKLWYPMGREKVGSEFFSAHKKYYNIYDTFATFESSEDFKKDGVIERDYPTLEEFFRHRLEHGVLCGAPANVGAGDTT